MTKRKAKCTLEEAKQLILKNSIKYNEISADLK